MVILTFKKGINTMIQWRRLLQIKRWLALLSLLAGCTEAMQPTQPAASGEVNTLIVIADKTDWEGPVGDTLRSYYAAPYLILPQPEPIFDLQYFTPEQYQADKVRREARNYLLLANLSNVVSPASQLVLNSIGKENAHHAKKDSTYNSAIIHDKNAKGQLMIYQFAYTEDALIANIVKNFPVIAKKFREADQQKLETSIFQDGENTQVANEVQKILDIEMRIPAAYRLASKKDSVLWLRKETGKLSSNILIKKLPYTNQSQWTKEGIKAVQDSIGRKYVSSQLQNTYMRINEEELPMFVDSVKINNHAALEARGIWEMENDYMGGAFISYLIHNPEKKELLFVDGFVHAPGEAKRNWLQKLEYILKSINF